MVTQDEKDELEQLLLDIVYGGVANIDDHSYYSLLDVLTKVEKA